MGKALASIDPGPALGRGLASVDKAVNQLPGGWTLPAIAGAAIAAPYVAPYFMGGTAAGTGLGAGAAGASGLGAGAGASGGLLGAGSAGGLAATQAAAGLGAGAGAAAGGGMLGGLGSNALLGSGLLAGSNVIAGLYGGNAARNAAQAQIDAANQANELAYRIYQQNRADQMPFMASGAAALEGVMGGLQPGGRFTREFSPEDLARGQDPGYAFRMSEGMKALERSAASRGGLLSGATMKGIQRYGQDMASQEYQNAFNRFQINRGNQLNPLLSIAGLGQTSTGQAGQQATNYANQAMGNITGAGNASAAGQIGQANALTSGIAGGLGQGINFYQNQQILNRLPLNRLLG
jgi:hypothetical protein